MQSLKSTAVAMILLAISFGLYNVSSDGGKKDNLIDPLEGLVGDGTSIDSQSMMNDFSSAGNEIVQQGTSALNNGFDSLKNKANEFSQRMPELPKMSTDDLSNKVDQFANNARQKFSQVSNQFSQSVDQIKSQPAEQFQNLQNQFGSKIDDAKTQLNDGLRQIQNNIALESPPQLTPPQLGSTPAPTMGGNDRYGALDAPALTSQPAFTNRQVVDSTRDDELIEALEGGFQSVSTSAPEMSNNRFTTQPIANSDNSVNAQATDISRTDLNTQFDPAVRLADREANMNGTPVLTGSLNEAWSRVDRLVKNNKFRSALLLLSQHSRDETLNGPQRQRLQGWLDALAGKVIYSSENNFNPNSYVVQAGESVESLAAKWGVPPQLIYNVNRDKFAGDTSLTSGTELKVVTGPFNAEIDLSENMMTLYLKDLYAGRFKVKMGVSGNPMPGAYEVMAKSPAGFTWRDASGNDFPPGSPENGYGPHWIGLSGSLCIHAVNDTSTAGHRGCIGLSPTDAKDVFGILAKTSKVTITR